MSFNEWKEYSFYELIDIIGGGTPKTTVEEYWNGHIPWLSVKDFNTDNRTVYETEKSITELGLQKSSTKLLNKGDLIISARGTVGALAQLGKQMAFNQSCYGLRANSKTTNDFLYYLLKYKLRSIQSNTHGSVFSTITKDTFKILKAIIPIDIEEQKAISKILSDLDEKIETNNKINKKLEEMAQAIFKQWFVDFEFPNEDGKPYKSSGGEMVESELGMIPKSYLTKNLNEIVEIKYGKNLPTKKLQESGYPVFGGNGIIGYYPDYLYEEPQVLIACRGAASGKVATSLPFSFITNNSLVLENTGKEVTYEYLRLACLYKQFFEYATGSAQPQITINNLSNVKIIVPNRDIIKKFSNIINSIDRMILNNNIEIKKLIDTREFLLPKLMSGEIRVPID